MLETVVFHGPASQGNVQLLKLLLKAVKDVNVQVASDHQSQDKHDLVTWFAMADKVTISS